MAATVQIHEMTAAGTGVDKTSGTIRFKASERTSTAATNADRKSSIKSSSWRKTSTPTNRYRGH